LAVVVAVLGVWLFLGGAGDKSDVRNEITALWQQGDYDTVYTMCTEAIESQPLDQFYLSMAGFSAYQIAIGQVDKANQGEFLDAAIRNLRKAMLTVPGGEDGKADGRIYYVLGKSYYYKGEYWADLAVKYLELADAAQKKVLRGEFTADDIPQFLGLAYASLHEYRKSVGAFSRLLQNEGEKNASDALLTAIARSYMELGDYDMAKGYLLRAIEVSRDSMAVAAARMALGDIYLKEGNSVDAEEQYQAVLDENGENAQAHYKLGELYAARNDLDSTARARAEWRKALRIDPAFLPARERLNM
jgi:tetratricopeptide (TPR) repeat protein